MRNLALTACLIIASVAALGGPAAADEGDDMRCDPARDCGVVVPDCNDLGGCPDPVAVCTVYAYVEGWRTSWNLGVTTISKANANGWGRIDCQYASFYLTDIKIEVTAEPGGAMGNTNTCTVPSCGTAASVNEGIGEGGQNCYSTVAQAVANGDEVPTAYALVCG